MEERICEQLLSITEKPEANDRYIQLNYTCSRQTGQAAKPVAFRSQSSRSQGGSR